MQRQKADRSASSWLRAVKTIENTILVATLSVMLGMAVAQIVLRNFFTSGITWGDGFLQVLVLWIGMLGAIAASRDDRQITVDVLSRLMPPAWRTRMRVVTDVFTGGLSALLSWHAGRLVLEDRLGGMIAFGSVPVWVCELILPLAFGLIALRYLIFAGDHLRQSLRREDVS